MKQEKRRLFSRGTLVLLMAAFGLSCSSYGIADLLHNSQERLVFFLSTPTSGTMADLTAVYTKCAGGDMIDQANCACQEAFIASGKGPVSGSGKFRAWLSSSTVDARCNILGIKNTADSAECKDAAPVFPYWITRPDRVLVFKNYEEIVKGNMLAAPLYDEREFLYNDGTAYPNPVQFIWTGSDSTGVGTRKADATTNCYDWGGAIPAGGTGGFSGSETGTGLSLVSPSSQQSSICITQANILCFEQP